MKMLSMAVLTAVVCCGGFAQDKMTGLRGDPKAIADVQAMVKTMGGEEIWSELKSIHFVHRWFPCYRVDSYVENEILDLTAPKSWVSRDSEINHSMRAYSPEGRRWSVNNGKLEYANEEDWKNDLQRAPFNFFRLIRAVAVGDPFYEVRFSEGDIPGTRKIEFLGPDGEMGGWVILNARKEPIVKATPEYRYTLGPLKRFGNILMPTWGVYDNGLTRYEMVSLTADNQVPEPSLFLPPAKQESKRR